MVKEMKESIALMWRRLPERYKLIGSACENCKAHYFPPRSICPKCRRKGKISRFEYSGEGKVYSFTEINSGPIIIELAEGAKCLGQIVDARLADVQIGDMVEGTFRKIQSDDPEGPIHYGFKFRLKK
jgi:uncharacterized OB-fold protein